MYWIKPRSLWGDYGTILFHGNAYVAGDGDTAPKGSTILQMCSSYSDVLLPAGFFICTGDVVALLKTRLNSITAEAAWVECQIEVPIERWMKRGEPKYPRGGEPESYFQQYDMDRDFEAGFGNDMFRVHHDSTVPVLWRSGHERNPIQRRNLKDCGRRKVTWFWERSSRTQSTAPCFAQSHSQKSC